MRNVFSSRLLLRVVPVALAASLAAPAHAAGSRLNPDEYVEYVQRQVGQVTAGGPWYNYAVSQANTAVSDAGVTEQMAVDHVNGTTADPGAAAPLGPEATGALLSSNVLSVDNMREDPDNQRTEKTLYNYGPTVVATSGGMKFFSFGTWYINQGDERVTFQTKACNEPSNGRGSAQWVVRRMYDNKTKDLPLHTCTNRKYDTEPVWYDAMTVGNGLFITYGRAYRLEMYWNPSCTGEGSPVDDRRPGTISAVDDQTQDDPNSDCKHAKIYAHVSSH